MSMDNGSSPGAKIQDEEGVVDTKVKEHLLSLRRQLDQDERTLFVERAVEGLSHARAEQFWGIAVRQYLRSIKRLWSDDEAKTPLQNIDEYWQDIELGEVTVTPPDAEGYQFSLVARGYDPRTLRRKLGLPPTAELPEPKTVSFRGLSSVLRRRVVSAEWLVTVDDSGPPPEHEQVALDVTRPVPKHILENTVEAADNFLQQAGIGFEVSGEDIYSSEPGL